MRNWLFAALFVATAFAGEISLLAPAGKVSLHTPGQAEFFALPMAERRAGFADEEVRKKWVGVGSRPAPVKFVWRSDLPKGTTFTLHLICDGRECRLPVSGNKLAVANLLPGKSYSWRISAVSADDQLVISNPGAFQIADELPRLVDFGELGNVRDLGGYAIPGGKKVRFDRIYRGRAFNDVSPDREKTPGKMRIDAATLAEIQKFHITTDLELRSDRETAGMTATPFGGNTRWERTHGLDSYDKILKPVLKPRFAKIFRLFLEEGNYPVYFHCDGGRDRTGCLSFLLLGALGVGDEDIEKDWQTSALFFTDLPQTAFDKLIAALREAYGEGTYAELAQRYLHDIGITDDEIAKFRELMLEN